MTCNGPRGAYGATPTLGHWRDHAACAGADPELFFPHATDHAAARHVIDGHCAHCPVQRECLDESEVIPHRSGIWGGIHIDGQRPRRDRPGPFTLEEMLEGNRAYNRHQRGTGPVLTDEQYAARAAYQAMLARSRRQPTQPAEVAS